MLLSFIRLKAYVELRIINNRKISLFTLDLNVDCDLLHFFCEKSQLQNHSLSVALQQPIKIFPGQGQIDI